jgi:hypothetical protein
MLFVVADSQREIIALYGRFCQLDRAGKGFISADEFMGVPEFAVNPLCQVLSMNFYACQLLSFCL